MENGNVYLDQNVLDEVLQLNISSIFIPEQIGNNSLKIYEFGRKKQSIGRVKELLTIECINLVNAGENKNSKKANVVEELISILNSAFNQSINVLNKGGLITPKNLGEKGQKELLLTKYLANVESRLLRDFVKLKKKL